MTSIKPEYTTVASPPDVSALLTVLGEIFEQPWGYTQRGSKIIVNHFLWFDHFSYERGGYLLTFLGSRPSRVPFDSKTLNEAAKEIQEGNISEEIRGKLQNLARYITEVQQMYDISQAIYQVDDPSAAFHDYMLQVGYTPFCVTGDVVTYMRRFVKTERD